MASDAIWAIKCAKHIHVVNEPSSLSIYWKKFGSLF